MSSNVNDTFDELMNEFTGASAASSSEVSPEGAVSTAEVDDLAPADDTETEAEESENESPEGAESEEDVEAAEEGEEASEEDKTPKPKTRKSAQERINEVVAARKQIERELAAEKAEKEEMRRRLEQLEAGKAKPEAKPTAVTPAGDNFGLVEPTADDLDDNGDPKYPLGSFDPNFMRDLNRYDRAVERAYEVKIAEQRATEAAVQAEEQKLFTEWNEKLTEAEKVSPKLREKAQNLIDTFTDANPQHMQTLAKTIMQLDNGPSVLEYLADNLDEADKIVGMKTDRALLYLGRLDGYFVKETEEEEKIVPVKATAAPRPPASLARGQGAKKQTATSLYDKMLRDFR